MPRRKFTREFKVSAVKLVHEQGYSIPQAARSLGVDPACVRGWVEKFSSQEGFWLQYSAQARRILSSVQDRPSDMRYRPCIYLIDSGILLTVMKLPPDMLVLV